VNDHFISPTAEFKPLRVPKPVSQQVPSGLLVSRRKVHDSLASIIVGKAIGPDMLPARLLKEFAPELGSPIMSIYNR